MIKAILFDLGGVIYITNWNDLNQDFRDKFGFDIRVLSDKVVYQMFKNALVGKSSAKEVALYLGHKENIDEIIEYYKKCYFNNKIMNKKMMRIVKELKKKYKLYVLTDANKEHFEADEEGGLFKNFEEAYGSWELGKLKTDKTIFEDVIKRMRIPAEEILFIDDRLDNLENAKEKGMKILHYDEFPKIDKFKNELDKALL